MQTMIERLSDALLLVAEAQRDAMRGDTEAVKRQAGAATGILAEVMKLAA